jgi:hypothetical protein
MRRGSERKYCLIKNNMSGDDDIVGEETETPIILVINGVFEEFTTGGPGGGDLWAAFVERLG